MKLTYYGHSCFSVEAAGKHVLFDPFVTPNPLASAVDVDAIPADYIFLSHAHFDHVQDVARIARRTGAKVIGNWEVNAWLNGQGISNTHPMNPGGKWRFDFGEVRCVTAQHPSSFADGSYGGVAAGYVVRTAEGTFYYSGDTALTLDMQLVPRWAKPDLAILPIGDDLTMGVEDAITAAGWLGVSHVVGVHYDTFALIKLDHQGATAAFERAGLTLHLLGIGSTTNITH
ncbi:MAG: metal-dependent hydrolase [Cytophagales bacterium]|nr:metal-dependent hydrolase [Cytophagales bacterium]